MRKNENVEGLIKRGNVPPPSHTHTAPQDTRIRKATDWSLKTIAGNRKMHFRRKKGAVT